MRSTVITNKHSTYSTESNVYDFTNPSKENEVEEDLDRCARFCFPFALAYF